ncbi:MAG TPA: ATP-binding protein [Burkholderiales bacterium]|nr:ATP-binding protein [Burkholderiales bacterium]
MTQRGKWPLAKNLERIYMMRNIVILCQIAVIAFVHKVLAIPLPLVPMGAAIIILGLFNVWTRYRLSAQRPVTESEFFFQILADVTALTCLLYFSGGSTNPFVSLYLIPIIVSAAALPWRYTWTMAAISVSCYTLLMNHFVPLHHQTFMLHVYAMWMTFVFSTFLIATFVVRMGESLRERDRLLAKAREEALRSERIISLGTLAAGAAHELGTPLATMAILCGEMASEYGEIEPLKNDLSLLSVQIDNCKRILTGLIATAGEARAEGGKMRPADEFIEGILGEWQLMRPGASFSFVKQESGVPSILAEQTLSPAILNLLNNAADASPECVEIELSWKACNVFVEIRDRGKGLTPEAAEHAGKPFFSTKEEGFGIGLFLANASIERMGGKVHLFNREGGGAVTRVILPAS